MTTSRRGKYFFENRPILCILYANKIKRIIFYFFPFSSSSSLLFFLSSHFLLSSPFLLFLICRSPHFALLACFANHSCLLNHNSTAFHPKNMSQYIQLMSIEEGCHVGGHVHGVLVDGTKQAVLIDPTQKWQISCPFEGKI